MRGRAGLRLGAMPPGLAESPLFGAEVCLGLRFVWGFVSVWGFLGGFFRFFLFEGVFFFSFLLIFKAAVNLVLLFRASCACRSRPDTGAELGSRLGKAALFQPPTPHPWGIMLNAGPDPALPALDARPFRRSAHPRAAKPFPEGKKNSKKWGETRYLGASGTGGGGTGAGSPAGPRGGGSSPMFSRSPKRGVLGCLGGEKVALEFVGFFFSISDGRRERRRGRDFAQTDKKQTQTNFPLEKKNGFNPFEQTRAGPSSSIFWQRVGLGPPPSPPAAESRGRSPPRCLFNFSSVIKSCLKA